jgi:hypothetical protein
VPALVRPRLGAIIDRAATAVMPQTRCDAAARIDHAQHANEACAPLTGWGAACYGCGNSTGKRFPP